MSNVICPNCRNQADRKISHSEKNPNTYYYVCPNCPDKKTGKQGLFIKMGGKVPAYQEDIGSPQWTTMKPEREEPAKRQKTEHNSDEEYKEKIDIILKKVSEMHEIMEKTGALTDSP
jgi:hypothetical protein